MLYFLSVTAASFAVVWLANLYDDRADYVLCFAVAVLAGAAAWSADTATAALIRRRDRRRTATYNGAGGTA